MASFRSAGAFATVTSGQTIEIPAGAGIVDGDGLVIIGFADDNQALSLNEGGWAEDTEAQGATGGDKAIAVYRKIASSESGTYTLDVGGGADVKMKGVMLVYQDVDPTQFDVVSTTFEGPANQDTHNPASITTSTDGAIVVSAVAAVQTTASPGTQPSGYTMRAQNGTTDYLGVADITVATAGLEDPGNWSGLGTSSDSISITFAIRPSSASSSVAVMRRRR